MICQIIIRNLVSFTDFIELIIHFDSFQADLEVQFAPEVQPIEEAKAGPGDEAKIFAKIRAFPGADVTWYKKIPAAEGEEEGKTEKIDKAEDKKWER